MLIWGFVARQVFYAVVSLVVGAFALCGAHRFRSSGLMALAFTHLLHAVTGVVVTLLIWQPLPSGGRGALSSVTGDLIEALSVGSSLINAILSVATVFLFVRDFNRWRKRLEEAEGQVDRLAQERMEREREGSSFAMVSEVGER